MLRTDNTEGLVSALSDQLVGISISDSDDLRLRGFLPVHIERALAEIATLLAAAGARVGYGGHLETDGFTHKLFRSVAETYADTHIATQTPPCVHYVAAPLWRNMSAEDLLKHVRGLDGSVEVVLTATRYLSYSLRLERVDTGPSYGVVRWSRRLPRTLRQTDSPASVDSVQPLYDSADAWRAKHVSASTAISMPTEHSNGRSPLDITSEGELSSVLDEFRNDLHRLELSPPIAFSEMRLFMAADEDARVVLGGKTQGYSGYFPGIAEETLYSLLAGNPVVGLRAFGGCAKDAVDSLLSGEPAKRPDGGPGTAAVLAALVSYHASNVG